MVNLAVISKSSGGPFIYVEVGGINVMHKCACVHS